MNLKLKLFTIALICIFSVEKISAQISPTTPIPADEKVKIGKLENGLTYYIYPNKKPENRLELRLAIKTGSIMENEKQLGLAHFVEHMCFNGTKNFEKNELVNYLQTIGVKFGADINAYTSFNETVYQLQLPTDKPEILDKGFLVLEDWASNVTFENEEIDKEREIIVEEWRLGLGADDRMRKKMIPIILKDSRYAERLPIGKKEIIETFEYQTIKDFYNDWYRPNLMAVIVVGDVEVAWAEQKIKEHFSKLTNPENEKERVVYGVPDNTDPLISIQSDKEASGARYGISYKQDDKPTTTLMDFRDDLKHSLFSLMLNERLGEISQKPESPYLYAYGYYGQFFGGVSDQKYAFTLGGVPKEGKNLEAFEATLTENERIRQHGFTPGEFERTKSKIISFIEKEAKEADKRESGRILQQFVDHFLTGEAIPSPEMNLQLANALIPTIQLAEINKLAQDWIKQENIIAYFTCPEKEGVSIPKEEEVLDIIKNVSNKTLEAYVDNVTSEPILNKIPTGSKVVTKNVIDKEFNITELTLANGVKVVLKPTNFKNDEILLSASSFGGTSLYNDNDYMSAIFAASISNLSGIGDLDNISLNKKLAGQIVSLNPYIATYTEGLSGSSTPKDFETLMQLTYMTFTQQRKDKEAFNTFMEKTKTQIKMYAENPRAAFSIKLSNVLSNNHPRNIMIPTEEQLKQVNHDRTFEIINERFKYGDDFVFSLVGNFEVDQIIPLLEQYLGALPSSGKKETWKDIKESFPKTKTIETVKKGIEPQSMVALCIKKDFEWEYKNILVLDLCSQILDIKLKETIREDASGVYGISASYDLDYFPTKTELIQVQFGCSPDNAEKLSDMILVEMDKISKNGPTEIDLNKVKEASIRSHELNIEKNHYWLRKLEDHYTKNYDFNNLKKYNETVNSISIKDIQDATSKYFDTQNYIKVTLMPEN